MSTTAHAAIQVWVLRDSRAPARRAGPVSIPVHEIASATDITPPGAVRAGQERCRIALHAPVAEPSIWVFGFDTDEEPRPPEIFVAETWRQVTALIEMATRVNRSVSTTDLGNEVAEAARRPVNVTPLPRIQFSKRGRPPPRP